MKCTIKRGAPPSTRTHFLLRWSRNIFLVMGVLLLGYCGYVLLDTKLYQDDQALHFQQEREDLRAVTAGQPGVHELAFHPAAVGVLGEIEIARIGVSAMIMEGTDSRTLRRAVGHVQGTPLPGELGNVAIAGHRDTFFRALRNVRQGDEITLKTLDGSYLYRVESTQVVKPDDTQVLDSSTDQILTLVTCYPFYYVGPAPKRFIVRAERILP